MSNNSVDMLKKLREIFGKGNISVEDFPKKEIEELIHEENRLWLQDISNKIECYEFVCSNLLDMAILSGETAELSAALEEIIRSQEKAQEKICAGLNIPEEFDRINKLRKISYEKFIHKVCGRYRFRSQLGENAFEGRGVVYTVITGDYDALKEPLFVDGDYDYICYTDNRSLTSDIWTIRYIDNTQGLDNTRLARKYKMLCCELLRDYDYSVYIDGKMQIVGSMKKMTECYSQGSTMLCFPHCSRECAYKEAEALAEERREQRDVVERQMKGYGKEGYPRNNGLIDTACLVRRHDDPVLQKVMELWWDEVRNKSKRDQLSIGYACWKHDFHYDLADLFLYDNAYLSGKAHK